MSPAKRCSGLRKNLSTPALSGFNARPMAVAESGEIAAAIDEIRRQLRRIGERQCSAAHQIARIEADGAEHDQSPRDEPAAEPIAGVAFDDDRATPQPVTGAVADRAAHDQQAAAHPVDFAFARSAEKIPGVTDDLEPAAFEARAGVMDRRVLSQSLRRRRACGRDCCRHRRSVRRDRW